MVLHRIVEFKLKRYDRVELPLSHAIDLLEIQLPSSPDIAGAWYMIGIAHYLLAQYDKALDPLERYIQINTKAKQRAVCDHFQVRYFARSQVDSRHRRHAFEQRLSLDASQLAVD